VYLSRHGFLNAKCRASQTMKREFGEGWGLDRYTTKQTTNCTSEKYPFGLTLGYIEMHV